MEEPYSVRQEASTGEALRTFPSAWGPAQTLWHLSHSADLKDLATTDAARQFLSDEFLRHNFSERDLRVLFAALSITHALDATDAWVPKERVWNKLSGVDSNHVRAVISALVKKNVLESRPADNGAEEIKINPRSDQWRGVKEINSRREVQEARRRVLTRNERLQTDFLGQLTSEEARTFNAQLHEEKVSGLKAAAIGDGSCSPESGEQRAILPMLGNAWSPESGEGQQRANGIKAATDAGSPESVERGSPTGTGSTDTERLYTVDSLGTKKSKPEILDKVQSVLPEACRTRKSRNYFGRYFENQIKIGESLYDPEPQIVARALWETAVQFKHEGTDGLKTPAHGFTAQYFERRNALMLRKQERERRQSGEANAKQGQKSPVNDPLPGHRFSSLFAEARDAADNGHAQ